MRDQQSERMAEMAAARIRRAFGLPNEYNQVRIGLILGTGWGDALDVRDSRELPFNDIPGFDALSHLEGHARRVTYGTVAGKEVIALRGRVHLNEGHGEEVVRMVRLQTEMLLQMGVNTLIVTSAVGSLSPSLGVGSVAIVNGFTTLFAPPMPLWGGEFCSPEDMLDDRLNDLAVSACIDANIGGGFATHAMVRGPFFEGRKNDKQLLRKFKADVVGMSMLPEACVAAVYGVKTIGLGFVTNNDTEAHSHGENMARADKSKEKLGALLTALIHRLPAG